MGQYNEPVGQDSDKQLKDVFISHSAVDRDWVDEWLLPKLEAAGLRVLVDYRDFVAGTPRLRSIEEAITNTRRTVAGEVG